jgi:putative flippase GtrA
VIIKTAKKQKLLQPIFYEGIRYILAGLTTTLILWTCFLFFVEILQFHYLFSVNIATLIAWIYAYLINKIFVFRNRDKNNIRIGFKFILLQLSFLAWTNIILYVFVDIIGIHYLIISVANAMLLVIINYICQKYLVFIAS